MMSVLRVLLPILLFLGLATWATGVPNPKFAWPDPGHSDVLIAMFGIDDAVALTSNACAVPWEFTNTTNDITCTDGQIRTARAFRVTSVAVTVAERAWTGTSACDVELLIDGTAVTGQATEFVLGGDQAGCAGETAPCAEFELNAVGNAAVRKGLSVEVGADEFLTVKHQTSTDDTQCIDGASCVCTAATGSYHYYVYGRFQ